jgi:hypothetical protein
VRRPNKLSASSHAVIRNMFYYVVLQRCSFFVLFKSQNALHIIFYTIIELRPPPVNYYCLKSKPSWRVRRVYPVSCVASDIHNLSDIRVANDISDIRVALSHSLLYLKLYLKCNNNCLS